MVTQYSRRRVLQVCAVGFGASVAGCTSDLGQSEEDTPTDTGESPTETEESPTDTATETPVTECATNYLSVMQSPEEELEGESYEKRLYENLSATQQDQFTAALNDEQPTISDANESDWYGTTTHQGKEQRIPLVIEYETELYEIEVHHADNC